MSFWNDQDYYTVFLQTTKLIEDDFPDRMKDAIVDAASTSYLEINTSIKGVLLSGLGLNVKKYFKYGDTGGYIYGLPEGTSHDNPVNEQALLDLMAPYNMNVVGDFHLGMPGTDFIAKHHLDRHYSYDPATGFFDYYYYPGGPTTPYKFINALIISCIAYLTSARYILFFF